MPTPRMVFTDLDGTLLNHDDYSWAAAEPAMEELRRLGIPLILVSSKTAVEMRALRSELGNDYPYVCENGSLVVIPRHWLEPLGVDASPAPADTEYYDFRGAARGDILSVLQALDGQFAFRGFADMSVADIVECTGLSEEAAALATRRQASEPIVWQDTPEKLEAFTRQLQRYGLRLLRGGRFYHVMGQCDKGDAVRYLQSLYRHYYRADVFSIALGDSPNDRQMLEAADVAVIMPHQDGSYMDEAALKGAVRAPKQGAQGWGQAVISLLAD